MCGAQKASSAEGEQRKVAEKALEIKADAAAISQREQQRKIEKVEAQKAQEEEKLADALAAATSASSVFAAAVEFVRASTGASSYVAITDLPEKARKGRLSRVCLTAKKLACIPGDAHAVPAHDVRGGAHVHSSMLSRV